MLILYVLNFSSQSIEIITLILHLCGLKVWKLLLRFQDEEIGLKPSTVTLSNRKKIIIELKKKKKSCQVSLFSETFVLLLSEKLQLNFICISAYRRDISICFLHWKVLPASTSLQTALLLEFIHLSCIFLEKVISRPNGKYLHCVFPFQLRAG